MRVLLLLGRDQNRLVYEADEDFVAAACRAGRRDRCASEGAGDPTRGQFRALREPACDQGSDRLRIQLAPANLHWCSDRALGMLKDCSDEVRRPDAHASVETAYQKEYARRRRA